MNIINVSKGLSLRDSYWIVEKGFNGLFADFNLYDNPLSQNVASISFLGTGKEENKEYISSAEFTTDGMLPKAWRRKKGKLFLYKGSNNLDFEPYSEFYAPQIASVLGINAVSYGLSKWKGELCSTCELFTSKDISFVSAGRLVKKGGFNAVCKFYKNLGPTFEKAFNDMIVFDALICNTDRHYGNFGFLVDSKTNKIVAPSPLFDHGSSLFSYANEEVFETCESLEKYINDNLFPIFYDNGFIEVAKNHLNCDMRERLEKLVGFSFNKHSHYNLSENRLCLIEQQIQERIKKILK